MNAAAYIRCSSVGQLKKDGPERQAHATADFAAGHDLTLQTDPRDFLIRHNDGDEDFYTIGDYPFVDGVTGSKDTVDRPGWNRLLNHCQEHGITTILVENSSRLGREPIVCEMLLIQCRQLGLSLIDCSTGMDMAKESEDPMIRCLQRVMFAFFALEKDLFVSRSGISRKRQRQRGVKCDGRKGYRDKPSFPEGPHAVTRALELRQHGLSYRAIARQMNAESIPTMTGRPWRASTVHGILNPKAQYAEAIA